MIANILFATKGDVDDILCDTMDSLDVICTDLGHPIPSLYRLDTNCCTYISIFIFVKLISILQDNTKYIIYNITLFTNYGIPLF